jgi:hypothetical protein
MGNQLAPLGVDYQNANAVGDVLNLPYFYGSISNDILDGAIFNRIFFPGGNIKKRRSMARSFSKDELPIVPPWGQRRLKRSTQTTADINRSQQEDEIMRGIYRVAHGLEKCQQEFYFCMENSAMDAATTTVFEPSNPATGSNIRTAISGLNRYKIALNEGNTLCKMQFPECVSGQLAVAVAEKDNP